MSAATGQKTVHAADRDAEQPRRRRARWWWLTVAVALVLAGAVAAVALGGVVAHPGAANPGSGSSDNAAATSLATVTSRSLSQTTSVNGTLGYAGSYTVPGQLSGTITALPTVGQVIGQGQVLYRVGRYPVVLLYGSTPAYRKLAEGATAASVTGMDVAELNRALVALGYASRANLDPSSDQFSWATKAGIKKLQAHLGVGQTGVLDLGQVVFLPTAARVTNLQATLGGHAGDPVLTATSTTRQVSVNLNTNLQSQVKKGDTVTIILPDSRTTPGTVASVGTVATTPTSNGSAGTDTTPTVTVTITPTRPRGTGSLDQAPVQVAITTATVRDALAVPVNALLALSSGGYAVEVADP
ncbi:MAG TPA: peptidoglycan-binding protein, partial [Streptosporangiaceae bacterium]|nr:peptidoglycan-binding protein [Streptosporangiaceae bacterium]